MASRLKTILFTAFTVANLITFSQQFSLQDSVCSIEEIPLITKTDDSSKYEIVRCYDEEAIEFLRKLHDNAHVKRKDTETLLKRIHNWSPGMKQVLKNIVDGCSTCIRAGAPKDVLQAPLSSMSCAFNGKAAVDILHYGSRSVDRTIFRAMRLGTSRLEMLLVNSRSFEDVFIVSDLI